MKRVLRILSLVLLFVLCFTVFTSCVDKNDDEKTVTLKVFKRDGSVETFVVTTTAEYLGEAFNDEGIYSGEEGAYGLYITTVLGDTADVSKEEWWCITKGGETVLTGIDSTPIADGDVFELTLIIGW